MNRYKIWVPEFETLEDAREFPGYSVREAIDHAAHDEYQRNGEFDELDFLALEVTTGDVFEVSVECESDPSFYVTEVKKAKALPAAQLTLPTPE